MKRTGFFRLASFLTGAALLFGGCAPGDIAEELPSHDWTSYFVYPLEEAESFAVDEDGNLYAAAYDSDILKIYDPYGNEIGEKTLPIRFPVSIEIKDGDIFTLSANELYRNDEKIYTLPFEQAAKDLRIVGDDIYLLYTDSLADRSQAPFISPLKGWNGEKLSRLHLPDLSVSEIKCGYPLLISSFGEELWLYGINDDGCYVASVQNGELSEPIPAETDMPDSFLTIDPSGKYLSADVAEDSTFTLRMTDPTTGQMNELMPNVAILDADEIKARDGYIYYLNRYAYAENLNKIERICQRDYVKDNVSVKLLATDWFSYIPFGCGRTVTEKRLSNEEFALTVLSQDRSFDACVLSSSQDFSKNFRDNGSFYALNDVPGVSEYVERCFPSVRDAVINSEGEIWALPLSINVPCAIYHTENVRAADFSPNGLTLEELIAEAGSLFASDPSRRDICISAEAVIPMLLCHELNGEADVLDRADFTEKMNFLKTEMSDELFGSDVSTESNNRMRRDFGANMLVMLAEAKQTQLDFSVNDQIHAADLFEGKNPADCVFLCVNPSSDNLSATLEYITALCGYLSSKTNDFMLDDPTMYSESACIAELFEIYRDSEIFFRIPDEILLEPVKQYRQGVLSLDDLISEADRKLSAYLNE